MSESLLCDHCGAEAITKEDGLFEDGEGVACSACNFPGTVVVDDFDDEHTTAQWHPDDDPGARCNDPACADCLEQEEARLAALRVYCINGEEWYVAASLLDLWKEVGDHSGMSREDYDDPDVRELPLDQKITIRVDDDGHPSDEGDGLTLTAAEWARREGPGMLCATDY